MTCRIPYLSGLRSDCIEEAAAMLRELPRHAIACNNWNFTYTPEITFSMAHNGSGLFVRFLGREKYLKATVTRDGDKTCNDSCAELFIAIDDKGYYNFEFNCIGTLLLAFGPGRENRESAPPEILHSVRRHTSLDPAGFEERTGDLNWELIVMLPASALFRHHIEKWDGVQARMNLYSCGDGLSRRHYLSWRPVATGKPDFHAPQYFENVGFENSAL